MARTIGRSAVRLQALTGRASVGGVILTNRAELTLPMAGSKQPITPCYVGGVDPPARRFH
jgi:hypothetical protein